MKLLLLYSLLVNADLTKTMDFNSSLTYSHVSRVCIDRDRGHTVVQMKHYKNKTAYTNDKSNWDDHKTYYLNGAQFKSLTNILTEVQKLKDFTGSTKD